MTQAPADSDVIHGGGLPCLRQVGSYATETGKGQSSAATDRRRQSTIANVENSAAMFRLFGSRCLLLWLDWSSWRPGSASASPAFTLDIRASSRRVKHKKSTTIPRFFSVPLLYHSMGQIIKSVFLSVYVCVCMYVCVCLWARLRSHFSTDLHEIW